MPDPNLEKLMADLTNLAIQYGQTRLAHEVTMLDDARQTLSHGRAVVQHHDRVMTASPEGETMPVSPTPPSPIHIGDMVFQLPKEQPSQTPPATIPTQAPANKPSSLSQKVALGLALGSTLLGGGGAGYLVSRFMQPAPVVDTDTNTEYELRLASKPKVKGDE